jgi:hypothetical protein
MTRSGTLRANRKICTFQKRWSYSKCFCIFAWHCNPEGSQRSSKKPYSKSSRVSHRFKFLTPTNRRAHYTSDSSKVSKKGENHTHTLVDGVRSPNVNSPRKRLTGGTIVQAYPYPLSPITWPDFCFVCTFNSAMCESQRASTM